MTTWTWRCRSFSVEKNTCFRKSTRLILKTINSMAAMSLKSLRDLYFVLLNKCNRYLEFILLCDFSQSRGIYLAKSIHKQFNVEIFDKAQCVTEIRFTEWDISRLPDALQLLHKVVCCQQTVARHCVYFQKDSVVLVACLTCILVACLTRHHVLEETLQKFVWYLIKYWTIFTTGLITSLDLGTKIFYGQINWHYIAT